MKKIIVTIAITISLVTNGLANIGEPRSSADKTKSNTYCSKNLTIHTKTTKQTHSYGVSQMKKHLKKEKTFGKKRHYRL